MKFVNYLNNNLYPFVDNPIESLSDIKTNKELSSIILAIRNILNQSSFLDDEISSFFRANILVFSNLPDALWVNSKEGGIINDDYFRTKLDINPSSKENFLNQLILNFKNKKVINIEYSFRSMEVVLGIKSDSLNSPNLKTTVIHQILDELKIFIDRATKEINHLELKAI